MDKEYNILVCLEGEEKTSQRAIARRTGMSLGAVNLLLGKMVQKGLVKIDRLNARSLRYFLTPRGIQEKARLTYKFVKNSYQFITGVTRALEEAMKEYSRLGFKEVFLLGEKDEVYKIVVNLLSRMDLSYEVIRDPDSFKELVGQMEDLEEKMVILWDVDLEDKVPPEIISLNVSKLYNPA